jgi:CheY-like chemotaxis protein
MRPDHFAIAAEISPRITWGGLPANTILPAGRKGSKPKRLVWVDDSEPLLELYKAVFESLGFEILTTSSPEEALSWAGSFADLVILDYDMPEMNGAELASLIKDRHPSMPVVLHSGNTSINASARCWVDAICTKGAPREDFLNTIDLLLSSAARRKPCQSESLQSVDYTVMFPPSSDRCGTSHCTSNHCASHACASND